MTACYSCTINTKLEALEPRHMAWDGVAFHVAHAFDSSLPGWMVIVANRHVTALSELTSDELAELGELTMATGVAVEQLTGVQKAYLAFFAEGNGFEHLHVHVIPRAEDLEDSLKGTEIFSHLKAPPEAWVPEDEQDRLAIQIRPLIEAALEKIES